MAGRFGGVPLMGLPGNPVSAMVTARLFLRPAIERMLGLPGDPPALRRARLAAPLGPNGPRAHYMRARVEPTPAAAGAARRSPLQDSSLRRVLARPTRCWSRPPHDPARAAGDAVVFIWL